jgi:three-Cys-motif partner protein
VIRNVGPWSSDKHHFLRRYIEAFTTAMGKNPRWSGLHYIDLFAGAGIERLKGDGLDWGSPLIAAMTPRPFAQLHLCDMDAESIDALRQRLGRFPQPSPPRVYTGDANSVVESVVANVPRTSLNLAFVDPYKLANLKFSTLRALADRRTDIIVFFPDHTDALRNLETYKGDPESPLSQYLGTTAWEAAIEGVGQESRGAALVEVFKRQMRTLGYVDPFEEERIYREDSRRLYKLVLCAKDPLGGKIWRGIASKKADGQRDLFT